MKCSFVIPGYKCDNVIERNIDSIIDQDYSNYEIIVVLNGDWDTRIDLYDKLKEKYGHKIRLYWISEGGLGNANNFGFTRCTGDIISHLSSDLYLMPGALRTWVDIFKENPDKGMVYSGYRFVSPDPTQIYYSNSYDRYHLECENFIDGANPVRRSNWKKWSTDLKSLVDWDFALSVTADTEAYYHPEPLYYAEFPKEGGLSEDSNKYWMQRRRQVQEKHNIPDRKICISSVIDQAYALELAKLLDCDFRLNPGQKPHTYDLIYSYGFNCKTQERELEVSTSVFFRHWKHKVIHWRTEDIRVLIQERWIDVRRIVEELMPNIKYHFCSTVFDRQKLLQIGLNADVVYLPAHVSKKEETIDGISVNDGGLKDQLERAMPDKKFYLNDLGCPITIHYEDRTDRICKSIAMGNKVIANIPIEGVIQVLGYTNVPELRKMVVHEIRRVGVENLEPDKSIIELTKSKINLKKYKSMLEKIADKQVNKYGRLEPTANA